METERKNCSTKLKKVSRKHIIYTRTKMAKRNHCSQHNVRFHTIWQQLPLTCYSPCLSASGRVYHDGIESNTL